MVLQTTRRKLRKISLRIFRVYDDLQRSQALVFPNKYKHILGNRLKHYGVTDKKFETPLRTFTYFLLRIEPTLR